MSNPARFLSRWSRLKHQAVPEAPEEAPDPLVASSDSGTDLTALLRGELSDALRKQTLKAIFADPHFNVMDGLDTYIDDYSISEPIPPAMLATLNQARFLFTAEEDTPGDEAALADGRVETVGDNLNRCNQEVAASSFNVALVDPEK